jgi:hypothetical protein
MRIVAPESKINANTRRSVALMYAELLAFEKAARESGIENSPDFQETLRLVRLRTVADLYRHSLEKKFGMPSREKVDEYYRHETPRFEEVKLRRIVLPKNNFTAINKEEFEKKAFQLAGDLRERARMSTNCSERLLRYWPLADNRRARMSEAGGETAFSRN